MRNALIGIPVRRNFPADRAFMKHLHRKARILPVWLSAQAQQFTKREIHDCGLLHASLLSAFVLGNRVEVQLKHAALPERDGGEYIAWPKT